MAESSDSGSDNGDLDNTKSDDNGDSNDDFGTDNMDSDNFVEDNDDSVDDFVGSEKQFKRAKSIDPEKIQRLKDILGRFECFNEDNLSLVNDEFDVIIKELRKLCKSPEGLLDDNNRTILWPILANGDCRGGKTEIEEDTVEIVEGFRENVMASEEECLKHRSYSQVQLDVDRSLRRFPPCIDDDQRPQLQQQLTILIVRLLIALPHLHYYQGFHDVAITFLLVCGQEASLRILMRLCQSHLAPFMQPTMDDTSCLLQYIYVIMEEESRELYDFLDNSHVGTIFALPWLITWFGHVMPDYEQVVRLYDYFLASHSSLAPIYTAAALVLVKKNNLLCLECDLATVHAELSAIPDDLDVEELIMESERLLELYPPSTLSSRVKKRHEECQRREKELRDNIMKRRKYRRDDKNEANVNWKFVAGVIVVTFPIFAGYVAYKWVNAGGNNELF